MRDSFLNTFLQFQWQPTKLSNCLAIVRAADIAKGSVYTYFSSSESIFLEISSDMLVERYEDSTAMLAKIKHVTVKQMAKALTRYPLFNPDVFRLHAIKPQLERSLSKKEIERYQHVTAQWVAKASKRLEILAHINQYNATEIFIQIYAIINGLWQLNFNLLHRL